MLSRINSHLPLIAALVFLSFTPSLACRCLPPTLAGDYFKSDNVNFVRALVRKVIEPKSPRGLRRIVVTVQRNYKGCPPSRRLVLRTPVSSATCGSRLRVGASYVIPIGKGTRPLINSCQFIRMFRTLTAAEKFFLKTRFVCCGKSCKCLPKTPVVQCFRQPCSPPEKCNVRKAKCMDNYCGGCHAEWFDINGKSVCQKRPLF